jgi:ATP-binding cassette, subfamily C (CFTR/MRP), member 2
MSGHAILAVYKQYVTEGSRWWGPLLILTVSMVWQGSLIGSDYWLTYETSFWPSLFINMYTAVSVVLEAARSFLVAFIGLQTTDRFFKQILLAPWIGNC